MSRYLARVLAQSVRDDLGRVRFGPGATSAEVPDLFALGAWAQVHYAISSLIAQKADILTIARIAGHRDPNVTLKVYGHLMRDGLAEAAELYDPLSPPSDRALTTPEVVDQW